MAAAILPGGTGKKGVALLGESPRYNMGRFTPIFALYLNIKYLFIYFCLFFILYLLFAFFCFILLLGDLLLCFLFKIFFRRFFYDHQCYWQASLLRYK